MIGSRICAAVTLPWCTNAAVWRVWYTGCDADPDCPGHPVCDEHGSTNVIAREPLNLPVKP